MKGGSSLIEKVGEPVSSIHLSLACKVLRNVCSGKQFSNVRGHGLLVHRQSSIVYIEVTLSEDILHSLSFYMSCRIGYFQINTYFQINL